MIEKSKCAHLLSSYPDKGTNYDVDGEVDFIGAVMVGFILPCNL
jgi:hypothetical protein